MSSNLDLSLTTLIKNNLVPKHEQEYFSKFSGQYLQGHFEDSSSCKFFAPQELIEKMINAGPESAAFLIVLALKHLGFKFLEFSVNVTFDLFSGQSCVRKSIIKDNNATIGRLPECGFVTGFVARDIGRIDCVIVRVASPDGKQFNLLFHLGSGPLTLVSRTNPDVYQHFSSTPRSGNRKILAFGIDETIVLHTGHPDNHHTYTISPNK